MNTQKHILISRSLKPARVRVGWFWIALGCSLVGSAWAAKPVGVVDDTLVTHEWWIQPWAAEWSSDHVADAFRKHGFEARTIGLNVLKDPAQLAEFQAIIIPTDHNYPDEGSKNGPVSRTLAAYVLQGGVYFMPFGASHYHWRDTITRTTQPTGGFPSDFLGLKWQITGEHTQPGPDLVLAPAGEQAGIPIPSFGQPMATYTRVIEGASKVYVSNKAGQRCLYAVPYGRGTLVHYTGGLPLNAAVRDWLIAAYSAILKSGPDLTAERLALMKSSRFYGSELVAERPISVGAGVAQMVLSDGWELAKAPEQLFLKPEDLDKLEWVRTRIPNPVQNALFEAGQVPNLWYSDNYKQLQWIQRSDWLLRKRFRIPAAWSGQRVRLRFDGLDYLGVVWLDGRHLGTHEGMAGGPTFDLTGQVRPGTEHELLVRLIHEEQGCTITYGASNHGGKPVVIKSDAVDGASYIWGNRYRSMGLWQPVRLVATGQAYMESPWVRTDAITGGSAQLWGQADITNTGDGFQGTVEARVVEWPGGSEVWHGRFEQRVPNGKSAWEQVITLSNPKLWWPNGLGEQPLYRLELRLVGAEAMDMVSTRFGVRTLELQRNRVSPDSPRSAANVTATEAPDESFRFMWVVNGRPFYAKGASWMTSDDVLVLTPEREAWLVKAAKFSGLNEFRLNGGTSLFETEQFYNLCDENGIVVWQELPLNWAASHGAPVGAWREQLRQSVLRIRQHASIGCWVGGNEFDPFGEGNVQLLGMAREILQSYDAQCPFRMSSPGGGTYHAYAPWSMYSADVNWYHRLYDRGHYFISEWSFPTFANYSLLKRVVPPSELDARPVGYDGAAFMKAHPILHDRYTQPDDVGIMSWNRATWYADFASATIPDLIECDQMAQSHTYGYAFEQWRAQFPHTGGQSVWTFNSMGPMSSWNYIDWFGQPYLAYYATQRANEPVHVMADTGWFTWGPGDTFQPRIFALNDAFKPLENARIRARLFDRNLQRFLEDEWTVTVPANGEKSPDHVVRYPIPASTPEGYFFLELTLTDAAGEQLSRQAYWLRVLESLADTKARADWQKEPVVEPQTKRGPWLKPQIAAAKTALTAKLRSATASAQEAQVTVQVRNTGSCPAYPVLLTVSPDVYPAIWSDNAFWLAPGETRTLTGVVRLDLKGLDPVTNPPATGLDSLRFEVSAWNAPAVAVNPP